MYDDNNPFMPVPAEVAGFELCGWKVNNGIILGPSKEHGRFVDEFPESVLVCGAVYTLEDTEWQDNGFGWGKYV